MAQHSISGAELMKGFFQHSPFITHLGIRLDCVERDRAEVVLPFTGHVVTVNDVVHGGAISSLIDAAATAAVWASAELSPSSERATIAMCVHFIRIARGGELRAAASVLRRDGNVFFRDVE